MHGYVAATIIAAALTTALGTGSVLRYPLGLHVHVSTGWDWVAFHVQVRGRRGNRVAVHIEVSRWRNRVTVHVEVSGRRDGVSVHVRVRRMAFGRGLAVHEGVAGGWVRVTVRNVHAAFAAVA